MSETINLFNDPRITAAIDRLHFSDDDEADVPGLDVVLIRIRATFNAETTFSICKPDAFVTGFGIRCYTEPLQIDVVSIVGGYSSTDQIHQGARFDVAFFSTGEFCPFDLGCFSNFAPLVMTFRPIVSSAKLEMILVGQKIDTNKAIGIEAGQAMNDEVLCINTFERWAKSDPSKLLAVVLNQSVSDVLRGEVAEWLGRCVQGAVVPALLELSQHDKGFVREGAVLGLGRIIVAQRDVLLRLRVVAVDDPSPGMRETARDVLGDFDETERLRPKD